MGDSDPAGPGSSEAAVHDVVWEDTTMRFHVADPDDVIQRCHSRGRMYEADDLRLLEQHVSPGASVLDVGANVGNHAIFFAARCRAGLVTVVEPGDAAASILRENVRLNGLEDVVDLRFLGIGLGAEAGTAHIRLGKKSLGNTRLFPSPDGSIRLRAVDALEVRRPPDLIKIDVEGMEMQVLGGARETIARHRPTLYVEVHEAHADEFAAFVEEVGYDIAASMERYSYCRNHLALPRSKGGS